MEWELAELERLGISYTASKPTGDGHVSVNVVHSVDGVEYRLTAVFPDLYPYFRPVVSTPSRFQFHQDPFRGTLCLLARDPKLWTVDDSLASLIDTQLPSIVRANAKDDSGAAAVEEAVPEPIGDAYWYSEGHVVFIDSSWQLPVEADGGTLTVMLARTNLPLRCAVREIKAGSKALATADERLSKAFSSGGFSGRWVRLTEPVMAASPDDFFAELSEAVPEVVRPRWKQYGDVEVDLVGVVFPDEVRYTESGDNWVFVLRLRQRQNGGGSRGRVTPTPASTTFLVRAMRAGRQDLSARAPALAWLGSRSVAVFGLGALGAPAALALARAGVGNLNLVDPDFIEAGTTPRWPMGLAVAGWAKAKAVKGFLATEYPFTEVRECLGWRLGTPAVEGYRDVSILEAAVGGIDLILDATANLAANHALADLAWALGLPYVRVTATEGAWGGHHRPSSTRCNCVLELFHGGLEFRHPSTASRSPRSDYADRMLGHDVHRRGLRTHSSG